MPALWTLLTLVILSSSCASPGKDTAVGAGGGAAAGAGIGALAGGGKGALIGAGIGALTGGAIGNHLDKQAQELAKVANAKRTEQGILVNLKNDLLFSTGSANLKPASTTQIAELGGIMANYPSDQITISGYTDNTGSATVNNSLSDQRAQAVKEILVQNGVSQNQIHTEGFGASKPLASNRTAAGRTQNRRVEVFITDHR